MATTNARMVQLIGSGADWSANDLVLKLGELGFSIDDGYAHGKIGDGVSAFSALPFTIGELAIVDTVAQLRASSCAGAVIVLGYNQPNDHGGGLFYFDPANSDADDGGIIIMPDGQVGPGRFVRFTVEAHLNHYGIFGDDATVGQDVEINAFLQVNAGVRPMIFDAGNRLVLAPIIIPDQTGSGIDIRCEEGCIFTRGFGGGGSWPNATIRNANGDLTATDAIRITGALHCQDVEYIDTGDATSSPYGGKHFGFFGLRHFSAHLRSGACRGWCTSLYLIDSEVYLDIDNPDSGWGDDGLHFRGAHNVTCGFSGNTGDDLIAFTDLSDGTGGNMTNVTIKYITGTSHFARALALWTPNGAHHVIDGIAVDGVTASCGGRFLLAQDKDSEDGITNWRRVQYYGATGLYEVGETITTSGGATGVVVEAYTLYLVVDETSGLITHGETMTGGNSGVISTVSNIRKSSRIRNIRVNNAVTRTADSDGRLMLDDVTGFIVGEVVTGQNTGAIGTIVRITTNIIYINEQFGAFEDAEDIEGGSSSTTANVIEARQLYIGETIYWSQVVDSFMALSCSETLSQAGRDLNLRGCFGVDVDINAVNGNGSVRFFESFECSITGKIESDNAQATLKFENCNSCYAKDMSLHNVVGTGLSFDDSDFCGWIGGTAYTPNGKWCGGSAGSDHISVSGVNVIACGITPTFSGTRFYADNNWGDCRTNHYGTATLVAGGTSIFDDFIGGTYQVTLESNRAESYQITSKNAAGFSIVSSEPTSTATVRWRARYHGAA